MFEHNESALDRLLRVAIGAVVLSLVFIGPATAWGWLGVIPLVTGIAGGCPLYRVLGVTTSARRSCCHGQAA